MYEIDLLKKLKEIWELNKAFKKESSFKCWNDKEPETTIISCKLTSRIRRKATELWYKKEIINSLIVMYLNYATDEYKPLPFEERAEKAVKQLELDKSKKPVFQKLLTRVKNKIR